MNNIFGIVTGVFIALLAFGFLIGYIRSWCKSLIRLGLLVAIFAISIVISPVFSRLFNFISSKGSTIYLFGNSVDLLNLFQGQFNSDIEPIIETTTILASYLASVILNLVIFIALFLILNFLAYLVYFIVGFIISRIIKQEKLEELEEIKKTEEKNSSQKLASIYEEDKLNQDKKLNLDRKKVTTINQNDKTELPKIKVWQRIIGGVIGMLGSVVIFLAILVPVFGVMNIFDKAVAKNPSDKKEAVASAVSLKINNFICGELYYTDDKNIGKIESIIEKYDILRDDYYSSFVGFVLNYTGIEKLGTLSFNQLAKFEVNDKDVKLSDEIATIIDVYDIYKENFVRNKFDINNKDSFKKINNIYDKAKESIFAKMYVEDIIPVMADKWSKGETFIGIASPIPSKYASITSELLKVFSSTKSFNNIDNNVTKIFDFANKLSEQGVIQDFIDGKDFITILSTNDTLVKDAVLTFSSTYEMRNNIANILSNLICFIYDDIVGDGAFNYEKSDIQIKNINFTKEAEILQNITSELLNIYSFFNFNESEETADNIINALGTIGKIIDYSRESKIVSEPLKEFIVCFISSEKVNLGDNSQSIKDTLVGYINDKWNLEENSDFSFETTFATLGETAKLANDILNDLTNISLDNLSSVLETVISNEGVKQVISDVLQDEIILEMIGDSETAELFTDVISTVIENSTSETLKADIEATQAIIDIISQGSNLDFTEEKSLEIVETIAKSETIINLIDETITDDTKSAMQDLVSEISSENKDKLIGSINASENLSIEAKDILNSLINNN